MIDKAEQRYPLKQKIEDGELGSISLFQRDGRIDG